MRNLGQKEIIYLVVGGKPTKPNQAQPNNQNLGKKPKNLPLNNNKKISLQQTPKKTPNKTKQNQTTTK